MEFRQLKYFVKVGETLNFSEAARELFVSQSTLSQQIRNLEEELNCQLLVRDSHSVSLTEEGRYFLEDARSAVLQAQRCVDRIADIKNLETGSLSIGCTHSFGTVLRETVQEFMSAHPNIRLNVEFRAMEELMHMLRRQEIDFALSYRPENTYTDIESHILFDSKLCVFMSKSHPFMRDKPKNISLQQLQQLRFALPTKGMQARNLFDRMIEGQGLTLDVRIEINEVNVLLELVRRDTLVTVLSRAAVPSDSDLVRLPIEVSGNNIDGCFHICRGKYIKKSVREFIRIVSEKNVANVIRNGLFE